MSSSGPPFTRRRKFGCGTGFEKSRAIVGSLSDWRTLIQEAVRHAKKNELGGEASGAKQRVNFPVAKSDGSSFDYSDAIADL